MSRTRIKTAVIGVGYLGRLHAQKYAMLEDAELAGVFDADAARAAVVAEEFKTAVFSDVKDIFGKVEAVSIVTPTEHHVERRPRDDGKADYCDSRRGAHSRGGG